VITNLLHDESVHAIVTNFKDVTDKRNAELKLEQRNLQLEQATEELELLVKRFKRAEEIANVGHWSVELATQKTTWSDQTFAIFGFEQQSVHPSYELFLSHI